MLPVEVTDEDLQQNPEFSKLLSLLSQHISSDGTSSQLEKDLQQVSYYIFMNQGVYTSPQSVSELRKTHIRQVKLYYIMYVKTKQGKCSLYLYYVVMLKLF